MPERAYELVVPKEEFVSWMREFTEKLGHEGVAQFDQRPPQLEAIEDARRRRFEKSPGRDP